MTVAGQTLYIATSSEDINAVWNNSKTISMIPISDEMYKWAGIGEKSRRSMFEAKENTKYNEGNVKALTPTQMVQQLHHRQLHKGPRLDELLSSRVIPSISRRLAFKNPGIDVSLFELCVQVFITDTTDAYFGPKLREIEPQLIEAFENWEQSNWKFLFQLPSIVAKDMLTAKATLTGAFTKYYKLPHSERPGAIFFVTELENLMREAGLSEEEMGAFTLLHYWAIVGNAYKLAFWLVAHLVHNSSLMEHIRQEVQPAVSGNKADEIYLLERCPKLESLSNEVLRLTVTSSLARVVMEPTILGGKLLQPGNKIMLPINGLHFDTDVWGQDSNALHPNRFIDNPRLSKNTSYRPWGGGGMLCPGRFFARRTSNAFVAILLSRYDLEVVSSGFPRADGARPSPGVVAMDQGQDVRLRSTPRSTS